jgi:hypothetical protein
VLRLDTYLRRSVSAGVASFLGRLLVWPLRVWELLRAPRAGTFRAEWRAEVDSRIDELWSTTPHGDGPIVVRDVNFLRWRFDCKPDSRCKYLCVESRDGRLVAWFACEEDGATLMVRDFWTSAGYDAIEASFVWLLLREARKCGHAAVSLEFGGSATIMRTLVGAGFSVRGSRPFFAYLGPAPVVASDPQWYVTSADEDE